MRAVALSAASKKATKRAANTHLIRAIDSMVDHVELKWVPVQREQHAQNRGLDRVHVSTRHEHDLEGALSDPLEPEGALDFSRHPRRNALRD